ncbi:DUF4342 domain-containing protein, partial [Microcoleus sp. HI-ES]|nr:DUF4342 domain-containing protein [Microcoleus sp. HI-ES]
QKKLRVIFQYNSIQKYFYLKGEQKMDTPTDREQEPVGTRELESIPVSEKVSAQKVAEVNFETTPLETPAYTQEKVSVEEVKINGDDLVAKVKELIHEGNIRRIIIKNEEGRILVEVPLTVGVVGGVIGAALFPVIAAVGAIGALVAHMTIIIERTE